MAQRKKAVLGPSEAVREASVPTAENATAAKPAGKYMPLDPTAVTSIVNGNNVIFIGKGAFSVEIKTT